MIAVVVMAVAIVDDCEEGKDEGGEEDSGGDGIGGRVTAVPSRPMMSGLFGVAADDRR